MRDWSWEAPMGKVECQSIQLSKENQERETLEDTYCSKENGEWERFGALEKLKSC